MRARSTKGYLIAELLVSMALLALLTGAMTVAASTFSQLNDYQFTRQKCLAAAQAQLESLATTRQELSAEDIQRLWPTVALAVQRQPGAGQWAGLTRLSATASAPCRGQEVRVTLVRYVQPAGRGT
jgi:type II secretory pathway pseudopilin PulG